MKNESEYSPALVRRLPAYFRALIEFYSQDRARVSSEDLARQLGLTPSQVRADLNAIGCMGQRSYGYGIPALYKTIAEILQLSDKYCAVIVGETPIANAIADTPIFKKRGVKLRATFAEKGEDPVRKDVLPFDELEDYLKNNCINIIISASSSECAEKTLEIAQRVLPLFGERVLELWNFSDVSLHSDTLTVKNVHLSDMLMILCLETGKNGVANAK